MQAAPPSPALSPSHSLNASSTACATSSSASTGPSHYSTASSSSSPPASTVQQPTRSCSCSGASGGGASGGAQRGPPLHTRNMSMDGLCQAWGAGARPLGGRPREGGRHRGSLQLEQRLSGPGSAGGAPLHVGPMTQALLRVRMGLHGAAASEHVLSVLQPPGACSSN